MTSPHLRDSKNDPVVAARFTKWAEENNYGYIGQRNKIPPAGWAQAVVGATFFTTTAIFIVGVITVLRWAWHVVS